MSAQPPSASLRVCEELPCPPQELVLHRYAPYFELSDQTPFALTAAMFPSLQMSSSTIGAGTSAEGLGETLRRMETLSLPSIPSDNIREDILKDLLQRRATRSAPPAQHGGTSLFPFSRCVETSISCSCTAAPRPFLGEASGASFRDNLSSDSSTHGEATLITGLTTGVLLAWNLQQYKQHLHSLWESPHSLSGGDSYAGRAWGAAKAPQGVALVGCQTLGSVTSVVCCDEGRILVSGGADGSLYLWDVLGTYVQGHLTPAAVSTASTSDTALASFASSVRYRNLLEKHSKVHTGPVTALGALSHVFVSGGADSVVRVWRLLVPPCAVAPDTPAPRCVMTQQFQMAGWVRSVEAFHMQAILDDEFIITDDAGWVLRLQSTRTGPASSSAAAEGTRTAEVAGTDRADTGEKLCRAVTGISTNCTFREKWRLRARSEETRRLGLATGDHGDGSSDTIVRTLTVGADRLIVAVGFSPVVQVMDTHGLQPVLRITHPSLTAEGALLQNGEQSTCAGLGRTGGVVKPSGTPATRDAWASLQNGPLRFIDVLYIDECDGFLLLDSRNTVLLYDRGLGRFTTSVQIPVAVNTGSARAVRKLLLPSMAQSQPVRTSAQGGGTTRSSVETWADISFFVAGDTSVFICAIVSSGKLIVNGSAHRDAVIGVCSLANGPTGTEQSGAPPLESLTGERIDFITISRDATLCCLDSHLKVKRRYVGADAVAALATGGSAPIATLGEVTAFYYSGALRSAVTGHESGGFSLWNCDGELTDIVAYPSSHANSVSGISQVWLDSRHARTDSIRLITVGFDGFVLSWKHVEKRHPAVDKKQHLSWSELVAVAAVETHDGPESVAVADQSGAVFLLETKELTPVFVCASQLLTVTPSSRWSLDHVVLPRKSPVAYGHTAAVACLCVVSSAIVSADDAGVCLIWRTATPLAAPVRVEWPAALGTVEIDCVCAVNSCQFVLATRGGTLLLVDAPAGNCGTVVGVCTSDRDVSALAAVYNEDGSFSLIVGTSDGLLSVVRGSSFLRSGLVADHAKNR